ncbi:MAG: hypothetical protein ACREQ5_38690, partial [Candidatus Dormibacteria bacterium]
MMLARFLRLGVIVGPLPNTLANGTLADATQVMADLNWIVNQVNTNAAAGGASSIGAPNLLINGAMLIAQRIGGTTSSKTITALRDYAVDRWQYACAGTINSSLIGSIGLPGFPFAQRIQRPVSGSSTSPLTVAQSLESSDSYALSGSTVTFSFWARSGANFSALGSLVTAVISSGTGTDESILKPYTGLATVAVNTFALSSGWRQFILTGIVSASATEVGISISYTPTGTAGSADYFDVTGCKLEIGNAASAYVTESFAATLAQCQRYYQKSFPYTVVPV